MSVNKSRFLREGVGDDERDEFCDEFCEEFCDEFCEGGCSTARASSTSRVKSAAIRTCRSRAGITPRCSRNSSRRRGSTIWKCGRRGWSGPSKRPVSSKPRKSDGKLSTKSMPYFSSLSFIILIPLLLLLLLLLVLLLLSLLLMYSSSSPSSPSLLLLLHCFVLFLFYHYHSSVTIVVIAILSSLPLLMGFCFRILFGTPVWRFLLELAQFREFFFRGGKGISAVLFSRTLSLPLLSSLFLCGIFLKDLSSSPLNFIPSIFFYVPFDSFLWFFFRILF